MSLALSVTPSDILTQAAKHYPSHELGFVASSAHDSFIRVTTFSSFNQCTMLDWKSPQAQLSLSISPNMKITWLLFGLASLQAHIKNLISSAIWLTTEVGAEQVNSISGLEIHLLSELNASALNYHVPADWVASTAKPDDEAVLFLTSGSTGFSKAVVHTHRTILAVCDAKGEAYGLTSNTNVLNWVGFDHVAGSLEMHIAPLLFGASQIHVHASPKKGIEFIYAQGLVEEPPPGTEDFITTPLPSKPTEPGNKPANGGKQPKQHQLSLPALHWLKPKFVYCVVSGCTSRTSKICTLFIDSSSGIRSWILSLNQGVDYCNIK